MTSVKDSTGVLDYIKGRRGLYGNTGEPPASTRDTGFRVTPNERLKTQVISGKYCRRELRKEEGDIVKWYPKPSEGEGKEKSEGSLSIFIVPIESREICSTESRQLGKGDTLSWDCNLAT